MSKKKDVIEYTAAPYGVKVLYALTEKALAKLAEEYWFDPSPDSAGICFNRGTTMVIRVRDDHPSTLMHECCHASLAIMAHVGINPCEANGEPMCYLLEHMWQFFMAHLPDVSPASSPASTHPDGCTAEASASPCDL